MLKWRKRGKVWSGSVVGEMDRWVLYQWEINLLSNNEKENEEKTRARDVVRVSPVSGSMYTKTVELTDLENTQEEDGASECNPVLRAESQKIFDEYRSGMEYEDHR